MSKKAIIIPIITGFIMLLLYYVYNVRLETTLPDDGWGRSSNLKASSKYPMEYYSYQIDDELHIFMPDETDVSHKVLDQNFNMLKEESIQAEVAPAEPIWASEGQLIYMDDDKLTINQEGTDQVIAQDITSFSPTQAGVLFWNKNELKEYNAGTGQTKLIHTYDQPIYTGLQAKNGKSFLVGLQISDSEVHFYSLYNGKLKELLEHSATGGETIENIIYDAGDKKATAIIEKYSMAQGQRAYQALELSFDLATSKVEKNEKYTFYDEKNGSELDNPRYLQISYQDDKPAILFVAEGSRVAKRSGYNVYYATQQKGAWVAERRSNTEDTPARPQWLDQNYITWQTFDGKEYVLNGTTDDDRYIESSQKITKEDYTSALYYSISGIFSGFFMLVLGLVWVVPPLVFYGILSFIKSDIFERNERSWVEPVGILLYIGTMIYMLNEVLSERSFFAAPSYLNFDGSLIIWPLIISIVTYMIYRWVMKEDTGLFAGLFYYIGYNLLVMTCLFGPYLL
ncbi:hypothetical protein [Bacillus sp. FJAT-27986]|uniref:hypothetical protein n=1 Tax=Bacillus sp. FJAT-27986 TaxID=1743146 RepID=UPI00080AEC92|nr:hypothetical protein [Bacillus sp. FJAT-27986]OCA86622.1 hypothetical protein A8L44_04830 [Bacillus sp. FJAT-27986]